MLDDIYFDPCYGKLYEKAEQGTAVNWEYSGLEGKIRHQFILRKIPTQLEGEWFDVVTPYGYGGPMVKHVAEGYTRQDLTEAFSAAFGKYCRDNHIVSEFVRFHPLANNAGDFRAVYDVSFNRHTCGTNLRDYSDPVKEEFSKSCRKRIRQALNKGVSWRITQAPQQLDGFKKVYYATMDRNEAGEYYYFDDAYFADCIRLFGSKLLLIEAIYQEQTIAAGLYFLSGKTIHVHLSGTLTQYLELSPAYILRYAAAVWGKENGYEWIHHGGGKSADLEDSLYLFKKKFAANTAFDFYIGKKIWDPDVYDALCNLRTTAPNPGFFPQYRG